MTGYTDENWWTGCAAWGTQPGASSGRAVNKYMFNLQSLYNYFSYYQNGNAGFCKQHTSYFASSKHSELQHFMIDS